MARWAGEGKGQREGEEDEREVEGGEWRHFLKNEAVNNAFHNGILLPKLFCPTVRKNCSSDRVKLLKFEAEGREVAKFSRSLEQFI